ncbi:Tn3 family transposase [Nonomuraea sp. NN258]|nr:Tn3 family transposase [Nonomuraea antri]
MIKDQAFGIASKIVSGTDRDCLHALDVIFGSGEDRRADVIVTDTGYYSDLVFGLAHLLDEEYRPTCRTRSCGGCRPTPITGR